MTTKEKILRKVASMDLATTLFVFGFMMTVAVVIYLTLSSAYAAQGG